MKSPCEKYLRSSLFSFIGYQPKYNFSFYGNFSGFPWLDKNSNDTTAVAAWKSRN